MVGWFPWKCKTLGMFTSAVWGEKKTKTNRRQNHKKGMPQIRKEKKGKSRKTLFVYKYILK